MHHCFYHPSYVAALFLSSWLRGKVCVNAYVILCVNAVSMLSRSLYPGCFGIPGLAVQQLELEPVHGLLQRVSRISFIFYPNHRRTELNYTNPPIYAKPLSHTPPPPPHTPSHHYTIKKSSHQLLIIFTHTMNTTKHSSSSLPKSGTTSPLISLHCDEYVYPPTTN